MADKTPPVDPNAAVSQYLINTAVEGIATNFAVTLMQEYQEEDKEDEEE